ncbi:MAG: tetratricopeptide repeat protein [Planctomycetota bacterium]
MKTAMRMATFLLPVFFLGLLSGRPALYAAEGAARPALDAAPASRENIASDVGAPPAREEIERRIREAGRTKPEWWDKVALVYPKTLDLSWSAPERGWDERKDLEPYLLGVVRRYPENWKAGIKLLYRVLEVNKANPAVSQKAWQNLGILYAYLEDWPRAAYGFLKSSNSALDLAHSFWALGSRDLAEETLQFIRPRTAHDIQRAVVLWTEIERPEKGLALAQDLIQGDDVVLGHYMTGYVHRRGGEFEKALSCFEEALSLQEQTPAYRKNDPGALAEHRRIRDGVEAMRTLAGAGLAKLHDGTYRAAALGFDDLVEVRLTVEGGRIRSVEAAGRSESLASHSLTVVPREIVREQGIRGVDAVTGATVTAEAVIHAAAQAIAQATRPEP